MNRDRDSVATRLFFGIHVRISKSTRTFKFRTILVSVSPRKFLKRSRSSSFDIENGNNIIIFVKSQELCVPVEIMGHLATRCEFCEGGEVTPPPIPSPPSSPHPPPLFPPHIAHILRKRLFPETVFINVCGAQELTRNEFRQRNCVLL